MEIRHFPLFALLCLCCSSAAGQLYVSNEDVKKEINSIKINEAYVGAEATSENIEDAFDTALLNLYVSINSQRLLQGRPPIEIETLGPIVHTLSMQRGTLYRVFVYISWAEIERNQFSSGPSGPSDKKEDTMGTDTINHVDTIPPGLPQKSTDHSPKPLPIVEVLGSLCLTDMINDALLQLAAFKVDQKITAYGKYNPSLQIEGVYYLLVFDTSNVIRAILEIQEDGNIWNIINNEPDTLKNYSGCYAFWFK